MFSRNLNYIASAVLVVFQQVALALSTYYIASAGAQLTSLPEQAIFSIIWFFVFALSAYILSSFSTFLSVRAGNELWYAYARNTIETVSSDISYCSSKNKSNVVHWVNGEAAATIPHATQFYLGFISLVLNVVLTVFVFYISIGLSFTLTICIALLLSALLVTGLRKRIDRLATAMQSRRLSTLTFVDALWDLATFGGQNCRNKGLENFRSNASSYFGETERYTLLEQTVACLPVITAVLAVVVMLVIPGTYTAATIGTLVAILPRSLQLFGNIHSLSMYLSQFYLVRRKVRNLDEFIETLDKNDFSKKVSYSSLRIINAMTGDTESPEEFERLVLSGGISSGRFCITGPNGAGKSSMLKTFKSQSHDSTLLLPDVNLGDAQENRSTGEGRVHQVMLALESESSIVMLDEWDANLDSRNRNTLNSVIDEFAKIKLIIEVKHVFFEGITV